MTRAHCIAARETGAQHAGSPGVHCARKGLLPIHSQALAVPGGTTCSTGTAPSVVRPILFSTPMVREILAGTKTQTRRVVQLPRWVQAKQPNLDAAFADRGSAGNPFAPAGDGYLHVPCADDDSVQRVYSPFGCTGDRLWVREAWTADFGWPDDEGESTRWWHEMPAAFRGPASAQYVYYRDGTAWVCCSDGVVREASWIPSVDDMEGCRWRPSIHMPRWASRILLELTAVRVERLQDISRADAKAEGFLPGLNGLERWAGQCYGNAQLAYRACWDSLNAKRGLSWDANPWVWVLKFQRVVE